MHAHRFVNLSPLIECRMLNKKPNIGLYMSIKCHRKRFYGTQ